MFLMMAQMACLDIALMQQFLSLLQEMIYKIYNNIQ
jgi:hypothetical protein